jgi:succinate dehydrogenase flavin-adding protein (antitoxin of CptAB toxin-antitoxin module)
VPFEPVVDGGRYMNANIERLKWRSRRGLLELDLVFERFWKAAGDELSGADAAALERLLQLPDNDLLDLVMGRAQAPDGQLRDMVHKLRSQ